MKRKKLCENKQSKPYNRAKRRYLMLRSTVMIKKNMEEKKKLFMKHEKKS